ncbi:MAG: hypothetical protein ACW98D_20825 [Promethearchaeota archaeon]|jgi:hypothetical protein
MSPTLTKNETKILETAVKIAGKFGKDEDKKRNLRSVMSIAEKFKKSVGEPRESLLKDIKSHNRKKSLVAVSKSINNMLAIYNIKKKEAQGESKKEIEIEPSGKTKVLSDEKKKRIRGRKVLPTPKPPAKLETMPSTPTKEMEAPKIKKEEPPIKAPDSIPEDEEVKVEEEANVEEEEAKVEEEEAKVEEDSDQSIPEPKVEEEPIKRKVEEVKGDDMTLDPNINPPSKQMGKRLEDLTVEEINKDLDYFYKNFGNRLRKIKRSKSKNLKVLQRFYRRVLAALRTEPPKDKKEIGVIIKGSDFIKDALKEIILENSIDGLSAQDLLINIEGQEDTQKSDAGQYEFKKGPNSGKVYAEGEPISRLIPTTEPEQVSEMNPKRKQKINRIPNPKTRYSGLETTAKKMVASNPFLKSNQPTIKLKTLY